MNEILEKDQVLSIVPQNFEDSNKGKIIDIEPKKFKLETFHAPDGILLKKIIEFYSPSKHGMLYFSSYVMDIDGNVLTVAVPIKHRFLQRRAFTRVKFFQEVELSFKKKILNVETLDISAGGMKVKSTKALDLNGTYDLNLKLVDNNYIKCKYIPIKIEKSERAGYITSGHFPDLSREDKMKLIQFCMRKNIENDNR